MAQHAHQIVSSESEELILVDRDDNEIGTLSKAHCHDGDGVLHRAFSLFIFNGDGELLLQQRSAQKRLWPLYWSNSCCSHPRRGESMDQAVERRLAQELGLECALEYVYKFAYQARFGAAGSEHELCSVFLGQTHDKPRFNATEIEATRFVSPDVLAKELETKPELFTPWFKLEWQRLNGEFAERLGRYAS